jgi:hypothetical protein
VEPLLYVDELISGVDRESVGTMGRGSCKEEITGILDSWIKQTDLHSVSVNDRCTFNLLYQGNYYGDRTLTASREASRHETKERKVDVSSMTQTGVRRFS